MLKYSIVLLLCGFTIAVSANIAAAALPECKQGEVVLSHEHRTRGLSHAERASLSALINIIEEKGNMVRAKDHSSTSRAGFETPQRCPTEEKICKNLARQAKSIGRTAFRNLHRLSCSYNYIVKSTATPNDLTNFSLWGLSSSYGIDAPSAWNYSTGSTNVVAAVIDTGIDYTHPDLAANIWNNPGEIAGNGIDDDANGYIDDVHGINAIANTGNPADDHWHGTHVSGTVGAVGNNGIGVVGVSWTVKLIGVKSLNSTGSGLLSDSVEGINYLVDLKSNHGIPIKVVNNSWGYAGSAYTPLETAIQAARSAGILFVAAAGNSAANNDVTPFHPARSSSENVIAVAALDSAHSLASFSNYGATTVHIAAPGVGITSTYPANRYASASGTSMAAPHVTGAIALLAAINPNLSWQELRDITLGYSIYNAGIASKIIGGRELNIGNAAAHSNVTPAPTSTPDPAATSTPVATATSAPTAVPTVQPTATPTRVPTIKPTARPRITPTPTKRQLERRRKRAALKAARKLIRERRRAAKRLAIGKVR